MITIKYRGEVIDPKDIEITWMEYGVLSDNDVSQRTGSLAEFGQSHYTDGKIWIESNDIIDNVIDIEVVEHDYRKIV